MTDLRHTYDLDDGRTLSVCVTHEGVIFDLYDDGELIGTDGRMADEWADTLDGDDLDTLPAVDSIGHDPATGDLFVTVPQADHTVVATIAPTLVDALTRHSTFTADLLALLSKLDSTGAGYTYTNRNVTAFVRDYFDLGYPHQED